MEGGNEGLLDIRKMGKDIIEGFGETSEDFITESPLLLFNDLTLSEMEKTIDYVEAMAKLIKKLKEIEKYNKKKGTKDSIKNKNIFKNENQSQQKEINPRKSKPQKQEFDKQENYDPIGFLFIFCVLCCVFFALFFSVLETKKESKVAT